MRFLCCLFLVHVLAANCAAQEIEGPRRDFHTIPPEYEEGYVSPEMQKLIDEHRKQTEQLMRQMENAGGPVFEYKCGSCGHGADKSDISCSVCGVMFSHVENSDGTKTKIPAPPVPYSTQFAVLSLLGVVVIGGILRSVARRRA